MGEVMQSNVAHQVEDEVRIIGHAPYTRRPHSPRQSPWLAPLPQGVKTIVTRTELDRYLSASYANWASNFALLTGEFITQLVKTAPKDINQLREWTCFKW